MATNKRCIECGRPVRCEVRDVEYPESGLADVYLQNVPVWVCSEGHTEVEIPAMRELHALLAWMLVRQAAPLSGSDIRFLRKEVELSSKAFAERLGVNYTTVSRWENGATPVENRMADLSIRFLVATLMAARSGQSIPADLIQLFDSMLEERGPMTFKHVTETGSPDATGEAVEWRKVEQGSAA